MVSPYPPSIPGALRTRPAAPRPATQLLGPRFRPERPAGTPKSARARARSRRLPLVALALLACLVPARAFAQGSPGDLDATFGTGGTLLLDVVPGVQEVSRAVVVDGSGRIVVAGSANGQFRIVRLLRDGALDPSFGTGGVASIDFGGFSQDPYGLTLDAAGNILMAGWTGTCSCFAVARLTSAGALDPTFSDDGRQTVDFGGDDYGRSIRVEASGKIVVAGTHDVSGTEDFAVARLTSAGALDPTFGDGGKQLVDFGGDEAGWGLALDDQGNILLAGDQGSGARVAVARLTSAGAPDPTFGDDGQVLFGSSASARAVTIDGSGRILVGGTMRVAGWLSFMTARLTSTGALDDTFGTGGIGTLGFGALNVFGHAMALDASGNIAMVGSTPANDQFLVGRFTSTGAGDAGFGDSGKRTVSFGLSTVPHGVAIDGDDNLVAAGYTRVFPTTSTWTFAVARLIGGGAAAPPLEAPGAVTLASPGDASVDQPLAPTLDWNAPATGGSVASYTVEVREGDASGAPVPGSPFTVNAPTTQLALSGLTPLTTYHWGVAALNATGSSSVVSRTFTTVPPAPTVSTTAPTTITGTAATLNGVVNPNGAATTYVFRYGTTAGLLGTTVTVPGTPGDAGASTGAGAVAYPLTGLAGATTYYYRVEASNAGGTATGDIVAFTTATAPAVTTTGVSGVTNAGATLTGTVNPNGYDASYAFVYGTDAELDAGTETTTASTSAGDGTGDVSASASISGLASGTRYYYRLGASNSGGATDGAINSFWTDVVAPTALAPTGTVSLEPTLDWNDQAGVTAYSVTIDDDSNLGVDGSDTSPPVTVLAGPTSQYGILYGTVVLANGATYYWQVSATGNSGGTATSAVSSFTTTPATILPVLNYPSAGVTANAANLRFSWSPGTKDTTYRYRLQVDQAPADWASLAVNVAGLNGTQHTVATLAEGTGHAWRIVTYAPRLDDANPLAGTTMSVTGPVAFTTSGTATPTVPVLSWPTGGAVVYTASPKLSYYLNTSANGLTFDVRFRNATNGTVYSGTAGVGPDAGLVTGLNALQYQPPFLTLTGGKTYAWSARACKAATNQCSAWSAEATFVMNAASSPTATPVAPTLSYPTDGVIVYGFTTRLSWYMSTAATGLVYRAYTFVCATTTCSDAPAITDANTGYTATEDLVTPRYDLEVEPGKSVAWYVRSRNGAGVQSRASTRGYFIVAGVSGGASAIVVPSWPISGANTYTLTPPLMWSLSGSSAGVTGYEVCYGTAPTPADNPSCAAPALVNGVNNRLYAIPSGQLTWDTVYYWFVRARGATTFAPASFIARSGGVSEVTVFTLGSEATLSWPTKGAVVWASSARLSWYFSIYVRPGFRYEVEVKKLGSGGSAVVYPTTTGSLEVTGLVGGASYTWRVRTCYTSCSEYSAPASFSVHPSVGGAPAAVMPFAESPAAGIVLPGGTAPVLSWSLPVEGASALTYDVEVAGTADLAAPQRFEGLTSPQVVLRSLPAGTHYWRVRARDAAGNVSAYSDVETFSTSTSVAAEPETPVPTAYVLETVYPNPATHTGTVRFGVPEATRVRLGLFDALGREVSVLVDGEVPAGMHREDVDVSSLAPGVYLVRMSVGRSVETRPLIVRR